jgi:phage/plasmid-like protein (TIGR03299 family)
MAHEITDTDKVLSVRQHTWHGLEEYSEDYLTIEDTRKLVHDWEVIREPVYRKVLHPDFTVTYDMVSDLELNVRTDNDAALSVVPKERVDISINEMYKLVELVQGQDGNVLIETAGSLRGGRDVFVVVKLNEPIKIKGDKNGESLSYWVLQNSYEVGAAIRAQATNVRVVCKNTSRAADLDAEHRGTSFAFSHVGSLEERLEAVKDALAAWRTDIREWQLAKEFMVTEKVTVDGINWFVDHFLPEPEFITDQAKANLERSRLELVGELFNPMTEGIEMTSLGLFEAASSWQEHVRRAQTPQSRFKRAVLSPTDVLHHARDLALEAVNV